MGSLTEIAWTHHTFNPWIGCTKVSPGCANCYAEAQDRHWKYTDAGWGPGRPRHRTKTWREPLKWDRACAAAGTRETVFCASLADIMDDEAPAEWRQDLWKLIAATTNLDWQLLTKRPQNYPKYLPESWMRDGVPSNVWIGTTIEDQKRAEERIPHLLRVPARVRFISAEPLLESLDLTPWLSGLHWVIAGGESGPQFREMKAGWALDLRDQCNAHDVPFFFKQWSARNPKDLGNRLIDGYHLNFPHGTVHGDPG